MSNKSDILGVPFNNVSNFEAVSIAEMYLFKDDNKTRMIFTPNPEIVMAAYRHKGFLNILKKADLIIPDGIGVVIASKITGQPLKERVAGYDLVQGVFRKIRSTNKTVYFFGGAPGVAEKAKEKMEQTYKGLNIVGVHDGYFDDNEEKIIIEQINELQPDLLLVGIGFPKQEKWIYDNKDKLNVKLCIGVGGSFDVMSGNIKRAPEFFRKLGLEWFYRLITQPSRFIRMLQLPIFILIVLKSKLSKRKQGF